MSTGNIRAPATYLDNRRFVFRNARRKPAGPANTNVTGDYRTGRFYFPTDSTPEDVAEKIGKTRRPKSAPRFVFATYRACQDRPGPSRMREIVRGRNENDNKRYAVRSAHNLPERAPRYPFN